MTSSTYAQLSAKLKNDLDLNEETFITDTELLGLFNEGVDMIEDEIHTINEDYFLTNNTVSLVSGTAAYALPSDIYAQKIRGLVYDDGSKKYEIRRIRKLSDITVIQPSDDYSFLITNDSTNGVRLKLYPTPAETGSTNLTIWYLRNAKKFATDADVCDIPEFENVLVQYVRWKCHLKEGHPDTAQDMQDLVGMKQKMVETLTNRIVDEDNILSMDTSFYRDFDDMVPWGMN